jgi:hypothetical protein
MSLMTEKSEIAHEILGYLAEHPDAQDSLEGIVEWWLLERRLRRKTQLVKEVLADLVAQGLVQQSQNRDAHSRYRLNPTRAEEIQGLLKKGERD